MGGVGSTYGQIKAIANLTYPRRGVQSGTYNYINDRVNTLDINLEKALQWSFPEDGTTQATTIYETGGNQDIVVVQNVVPLEATVPYINTSKVIMVANLNSPNPTALLNFMANNDLTLFSWPPVSPQILVQMFGSGVGIEQFVIGDDISVSIPQYAQDGKVFDPRFPLGIYNPPAEWRIISYNATVGDSGLCTLNLTLDTPPIANKTNPMIPPQSQ